MNESFADALDRIINTNLAAGGSLDDICSELELKTMAVREQLANGDD